MKRALQRPFHEWVQVYPLFQRTVCSLLCNCCFISCQELGAFFFPSNRRKILADSLDCVLPGIVTPVFRNAALWRRYGCKKTQRKHQSMGRCSHPERMVSLVVDFLFGEMLCVGLI